LSRSFKIEVKTKDAGRKFLNKEYHFSFFCTESLVLGVTASFGNGAVFLTEKERNREKMYSLQRKED